MRVEVRAGNGERLILEIERATGRFALGITAERERAWEIVEGLRAELRRRRVGWEDLELRERATRCEPSFALVWMGDGRECGLELMRMITHGA